VTTTSPAGVPTPKPTASGIEWQTRNGSTAKTPARIGSVVSGSNSRKSAAETFTSSSLPLINPNVSRVAQTGTGRRSFSRYGRAPMWSSWPWVMKIPRSRSLLARK
jgi:hypothetical protein